MSRRRMAFESLPQAERTIVRDALQPWVRRGIEEPNQDLWDGATADQFIQRHDMLRDDLAALSRRGQERDMMNILMGRHNHNLEDATDQVRRIRDSRNPERMNLQKLVMSVPQAEADEHLSRAALQLSGYGNVGSLKDTTTKATDIYAEDRNGDEVLIDAQVRGNPNGRLNLSMLKGINLPASELQREFMQLPDNALMMDFIRKVRDRSRDTDTRDYQSAKEGKLMQTDNGFNDRPTAYFEKNKNDLRKDAIITSLRPLARDHRGKLLPHKDHPRLKNNSPAYNPELPVRWDLLDLDIARSVLTQLKKEDLFPKIDERGVKRFPDINMFINEDDYNQSRTESINIGIEQRKLEEMLGKLAPLSSTVREALVRPQ